MSNLKITKLDDNRVVLEGRLDTTTAPDLEVFLEEGGLYDNDLLFDFKGLDYISSAGLRIMLSTLKKVNKNNYKLKIANMSEIIKEVFEVTGFIGIFEIV